MKKLSLFRREVFTQDFSKQTFHPFVPRGWIVVLFLIVSAVLVFLL